MNELNSETDNWARTVRSDNAIIADPRPDGMHYSRLSDDLKLPEKEEIYVTSLIHEPKNWFYQKIDLDPQPHKTLIREPKPIMMWATCQRIGPLPQLPDEEHQRNRITNIPRRWRKTEIRPVIDLGGGVLGVAPWPVELIQVP